MVGEVPILSEMQELREIRKLELIIRQRKEQAEKLRQTALLLGSLNLNPDKVQTSKSGSIMEDSIIRLVELENQIRRLVVQYEVKRARIITKIQKLDNVQHIDILHKRYVEGMSFKQIAQNMNISESYAPHLLTKALKEYRISNGRSRSINIK